MVTVVVVVVVVVVVAVVVVVLVVIVVMVVGLAHHHRHRHLLIHAVPLLTTTQLILTGGHIVKGGRLACPPPNLRMTGSSTVATGRTLSR